MQEPGDGAGHILPEQGSSAEGSARLPSAEAGGLYLFEMGPDHLAWCDDGLRVLLGLAQGERLDRRRWLESVHPDDRDRLEAEFSRVMRDGGSTEVRYRVLLPDGTVRWLLSRARSMAGPDRPGPMCGVTVDITGRKVAVARLQESQRALEDSEARLGAVLGSRHRAMTLLRTFAEAVPGVVYATDREGRLLLANEGTAAAIGKPAEAFIGRTLAEVLDDKQQAAAVMENDRRVLASGIAAQLEEEVGWRDGMPVVWLATKAPLRDEAGQIIGLVATSLDITERKKAEAIIARGKVELEHLVEERTRDLRETQAQLAHAQRMEALGRLAGGIAHDFNNVLQAIEDGALLIERRAADPKAVRHLASMVIDAARRGASITRRLLSFSRRDELRAEPLEPTHLLSDLREMLCLTLGTGIKVRMEAAAGLPLVLADKGQLETVLINLATNARDAMGGSGTLTLAASLETRPPDSGVGHPALPKAGSYVRLSVADTGRGMDADTLARATEPFFTTKGPGKGTGLGLAMARGFAEQSGGGLHIESGVGQGTTVTLWLPLADAEAAPAEQPEDAAAPAAGRRRILLVDDYDLMREMLAENLSEAGYEVIQAQDGTAALAWMEMGEQVDLLVSDLSMPGMNGVALIRAAQRQRPDLPAILLTGFAGDAAELEDSKAGDDSFSLLRKPIIGPQLARCVASVLRAGPGERRSP